MKLRLRLFFIIILVGQLRSARAQDYLWYNSSNYFQPQILFTNPAGTGFWQSRQVVLSSQLLFTGLANDKLYNHYLGYAEPLAGFGVLGVRGSFFRSNLLNDNNFSLFYARSLVNHQLSVGINLNVYHHAFDRGQFQLVDADDPLLEKGTSATAFGAGLGLIYQPFSALIVGVALDHLNQPDISIEGNQETKPLVANFGLSYRIFNFMPEFEVKHRYGSERSETHFILGLRQMWLHDLASLFVQYQSTGLAFGGAYAFRNFRLDYHFGYPLNELSQISNGSHHFTLTYNFDHYSGFAVPPEIRLISPLQAEVDTNFFRLEADVIDKFGLKQIRLELNGQEFDTYHYSGKERLANLEPLISPLKKGENQLKIIAQNQARQSTKLITIHYQLPEPEVPLVKTPEVTMLSEPKVEILTPLDAETGTSSLRLRLSAEFVVNLNDIKIKVNGKDFQFRGQSLPSENDERLNFETELDLEEGMNEIEVIAFNSRGTRSRKTAIRYNPIQQSLYNKLWGVVIGIDDYYQRDVQDLKYAVHDARGIEQQLRERFHFDKIITLYNREATRDNILRAFSSDLKEANEDDGVFVFFAGHGTTGEGITGGPLGYIVPYDGTFDEKEFYVKNIPMSLVKEISQTIKAKHLFYVMDCCYGGLLLREGVSDKSPGNRADYNYLRSLAKQRVRQVLTAGGQGQPVLDGGLSGHSVFTGRLVQGLKGEADFNQDGFITAEEINFFVRQRVHVDVKDIVRGHPAYKGIEQTPQYGKWFGEGEFVFSVRK